jgi:hypothetical protein
MAKKEFTAKGWKSNKEFDAFIKQAMNPKDVADYILSPKFTEKDYIDVLSGMYDEISPGKSWGWGQQISKALKKSPFHKLSTNEKALDFAYDVKKLKEDWNAKNPKNPVDLDSSLDNINHIAKAWELPTKAINKLVSEPQYMLPNSYSKKQEPPVAVLKNDKIKPEHLYKFLNSHPEHVSEVVSHEKADARLHDMIFDKPEHIKNLTGSDIESYLSKHLVHKQDEAPRLDISPKRAKQVVEHGHDKLYGSILFQTLGAMDPEEKKNFIDRKLGITGGKSAGLGAWRTGDETTNQEVAGKWGDWENGPEYDPKFAQTIAKSPHLSDDQADHIKRQGSFDEQYSLYHNKHVDPKHGAEMFKLWHDDETSKGYLAEQLQDKYKRDKDDVYTLDDIDQDLLNEEDLQQTADESVQESYSFSDWVDDNEDDLVKEVELEDDDQDKISEKLMEDYDWTGENPSHDSVLHNLHQKLVDHMDNEGLDSIHIDEAEGHLGVPRKEWQGNTIGHSDGTIDKDSLEEYMQDNNPKEIDYANHDAHTLEEHPDHDERYNEIADEVKLRKLRDDPWSFHDTHYDDYSSSDKYNEHYTEAMNEAKEEAAKEHYKELYSSSHQDDRFVPEHLHAHIPNFEDLKKKRKKAIGEPADFLDKHIPNRSYEHAYGDEQHLHELLKNHADANGGAIDIGRMHKLMPNQGDAWKKIFGPKGKISSDEIQTKIDGLNKTPYAISYGKWDGNKMQNVNGRDQVIFRLDHTDESLKPLQEDPELFSTFNRVQEVSKRSGHPTKDKTIAWARVDTTDPDHWMIDEVQSDFGKTVRDYLKKEGNEEKAGHIQKISDYHKDWRETLMNHVIKEAKKHGASKVSTHSPESKASHTGAEKAHSVYQDSYKKVPRKMGFKPSPAQTLPITEKTREGVFNKNDTNPKELMENHTDAWNHHKSWANAYLETAEKLRDPAMASDVDTNAFQVKQATIAEGLMNMHTNLAEQHGARAKTYGQTHDNVSVFPIVPTGSNMLEEASSHMANGTHEKHAADKGLETPPVDFSKKDYHEGHTLNLKPNLIKAMLDIVEDLVKFELIAKNSPNVEITKRANHNIDLIKKMLGYESDLSKWEARGKSIIAKAVQSPNKHIGLNRLKQIQTDNAVGAGGQEYDEGELKNAINERGNAQAAKMVRGAGRQEKQRAQDAQNQSAGIGGATPENSLPPTMPGPKKSSAAAPMVNINPEHGKQIANAYEQMSHNPHDPQVSAAYGALIKETSEQFKNLMGKGLRLSRIQPGQENPYKTSKDLHHDLETNNHLHYFPTESGFGSEGSSATDHPMLAPTQFSHDGKKLTANDLFRIVHDINGHHLGGKTSFGPKGEHQAYLTHKQMYSPLAQKALATETLMQNSWVNFSDKTGEHNRKNPSQTIYADQKAAIAPDWVVNGKWHQ